MTPTALRPSHEMKRRIDSIVSTKWFAALSAFAAFLVLLAFGEAFLQTQQREMVDRRKIEAAAHAATLRARLERELNSLLYLNSGLGSYLVVHNKNIEPREVRDILAVLHRSSRHVRNFGIAVGYRLSHVYPIAGNEKAIGIDYRNLPDQWPVIERIIANGKPALAGPVDLVQGGSGLIYRVPLYLDGKYWGLLSTVIDTDSLLQSAFEEASDGRYEYALRGKDGEGFNGAPIVGDVGLFAQPDAMIHEIEIPGGRWAIAVKVRDDTVASNLLLGTQALVAVICAVIASLLYALIRSRAELARLVMFDSLTGLPNRRLFTDRARVVFARQHRHPNESCALLFLDMDGFKDINDRHGHKAGDTVLSETADRCRATVRSQDTVARWGGDEFVVLLEDVSEATVTALVTRLRTVLEAPVCFGDLQLRVGVSVGVVIHHEGDASLDEILEMADQRMYVDKSQRKSGN